MEITRDFPATVPIRDSKTPTGPTLLISRRAWSEFVASLS
ncbi:DUF397 domain-containing protein [Streptomyces brasiliensis]|nr:DUF397 domain-containing protein [Streptomyces brasiliensis]